MIKKDDKTIKLKVIKTNNKHTYIRPENGYLEVKLGKYMNLDTIKDRILAKFDKYYYLTEEISNDYMHIWGEVKTLKINDGVGFKYRISGDFIDVYSNKNLEEIKANILLEETKAYLNEILEEVNLNVKSHGYKIVPIKLKKLKSKFGSYHLNKNEIILNVLLASYKKECMKYVLYHEYTHQRYPNHQKSFYKALNILYPNYKEVEKLLKKKRIY